MNLVSRLLDVPSTDPGDARRRKLLNILLVGIAVLMLLLILVTAVASMAGVLEQPYTTILLRGSLMGLAGAAIIFFINRHVAGWLASALFLLLLMLIIVMSDEPAQVVDGRSLFAFAVPIIMASVLLRPRDSFIAAGTVSVLLVGIALNEQIVPNLVAIVGFFAIAFVSWLAARSLESALEELHETNLELDQRVEQRTEDLAEALARERAEASRSQAILEGIADGVIVFDTNGMAVVANPAIARILDRSSDAIIGSNISRLMGENIVEADLDMLIDLLGGRELNPSSVKIDWGDKTLSVSFAPVRAAPHEVIGTVAVFRDFTHEAEIDRMKSDFVSIVSHELRTPLTSIKGYLDLVLMGASGPTSKQQESFLQIAKSNTDRLHGLVSDLLDISRMESGRMELDVQVVSMLQVVQQVSNSMRKAFQDRGLTLTVDVPPELPEILGDPSRISQILMNLLSNAYKYTTEGGAILRVRPGRRALQIDVIDTGVGISLEDQEKLFTPFFRADEQAVRQETGSGLGLTITKSLVEMHGGEMRVTSKPGKGSTFTFSLPRPAGLVAAQSNQRPESPEFASELLKTREAREAPIPAGPWILVADDEADVAHLFQQQLRRAGYRVTVVNQGSQVKQVARQLKPELITLDLLMDIDGLAILQDLKADPDTADIPVVIISVIPEPQEGLALGAVDYLVKPLEEDELTACIGRVLNDRDNGHRSRILVVDDEADIVGWLKHLLTHSGYRVSEAYDGIQALEAVAADKPDLILLDMKMPRMDGRTTLRRLRAEEEFRDIPVIVLSAHAVTDGAERRQMMDLGVREFMNKPVTMERLVDEIQKHLRAGEGGRLELNPRQAAEEWPVKVSGW
jgi:PAS domain S-box-containing protein